MPMAISTVGKISRATNTDIESVYADLYGVINNANFLLDNNVDKVKANTNSDKELDKLGEYQGGAYLRALAYSELIKCFCKAYDSDEQAEKELGVVLTEHYYGNEPQRITPWRNHAISY